MKCYFNENADAYGGAEFQQYYLAWKSQAQKWSQTMK